MNTLYTVRRVRKNDELYGSCHGSRDGYFTVCGKELNHNWWIVNNTFDGEITCLECIKNKREYE